MNDVTVVEYRLFDNGCIYYMTFQYTVNGEKWSDEVFVRNGIFQGYNKMR